MTSPRNLKYTPDGAPRLWLICVRYLANMSHKVRNSLSLRRRGRLQNKLRMLRNANWWDERNQQALYVLRAKMGWRDERAGDPSYEVVREWAGTKPRRSQQSLTKAK